MGDVLSLTNPAAALYSLSWKMRTGGVERERNINQHHIRRVLGFSSTVFFLFLVSLKVQLQRFGDEDFPCVNDEWAEWPSTRDPETSRFLLYACLFSLARIWFFCEATLRDLELLRFAVSTLAAVVVDQAMR